MFRVIKDRLFDKNTRRSALPPVAIQRRLIPAGLEVRTHADGVLFLNIPKGLIFISNAVGATIWNNLQDGESLAKVAEFLSLKFGISQLEAERDTRAFIDELCDRGLLLLEGAR